MAAPGGSSSRFCIPFYNSLQEWLWPEAASESCAVARILLIPCLQPRRATMHARHRSGFEQKNTVLTLGDAVAAVSAVTSDEREVVAVVLHMLRRQSIRLAGVRPLHHSVATPG
jgi:hypothetical protein